jgi:hypothetical protein
VERIGRRVLWLTSFVGMFFSFVFVMGFSAGFSTTGKPSIGIAAVPFLFTFYGFYDIAWTTVGASCSLRNCGKGH